ncbi:unnamed protein product [Caenorhabditis auriculariae]|uniref:Uncharacterized protein n=1 Tax=Caenorhabditis auriculariae TaxID=2777116 RepID=A0A8S1HGF4_9PELO|nr:unnamed protein product [Caenorhabditis auriculariae]
MIAKIIVCIAILICLVFAAPVEHKEGKMDCSSLVVCGGDENCIEEMIKIFDMDCLEVSKKDFGDKRGDLKKTCEKSCTVATFNGWAEESYKNILIMHRSSLNSLFLFGE